MDLEDGVSALDERGSAPHVPLPPGLTFCLLHRIGCSAASIFQEVPAELGDLVASPNAADEKPIPRACFHLICSRQYKIGLNDRSPETVAAWTGKCVRLWLAYRENSEQVLHAFWPNGTPLPIQAKRLKWRMPLEGPRDADVGPLLRFQTGGTTAFRNAVSCREVVLRMGPDGLSEGAFGFVATSFCHGKRAFCLRIESEAAGLKTVGRIELTTRTHQRRGRNLGVSIFGAGGAAVPPASSPEPGTPLGSADDSDDGMPEPKRRGYADAADGGSPRPIPRPSCSYNLGPHAPNVVSPLVGLLDQLHVSDQVGSSQSRQAPEDDLGRTYYPAEAYTEIAQQWEASVRQALRNSNRTPSASPPTQRAFDELIPCEDELEAAGIPSARLLADPPGTVPNVPPTPPSAPRSALPGPEDRPLWFLRLAPAEVEDVMGHFARAFETGPTVDVDMASKLLLDPRILGTPLVSSFPGQYRLTQALHRLLETGARESVRGFVSVAVGTLLGIPVLTAKADVAVAVTGIIKFLEAATAPVPMVTPQLLVLSDADARLLVEAAGRLLSGYEDELRTVHCEFLFRRAVVEWQMDREPAALDGLFECWAAVVRYQLAPCRLEARLLHHLLNLSMRVPGNLAIAKHLTTSVYWFEETPDDLIDKALGLLYLGLVEGFRSNLPAAISYMDRSLAALQELAPQGDCYRQLTIRVLITRSVTNTLMSRLASATQDYRLALVTMKETCRTPSPFWDLMYLGRHQYKYAIDGGTSFGDARNIARHMRLNLLAIKVSDLKNETPLRGHALARTGEYYMAIRRYPKAVACLDEALRLLQAHFPRVFCPGHPYLAHLSGIREVARARLPLPRPPLPLPRSPEGAQAVPVQVPQQS